METIKDTGPQLIAVFTNKVKKEIPVGKIRLTFVRYSVVEYDLDGGFDQGQFQVHDANQEEARLVAQAVNSREP